MTAHVCSPRQLAARPAKVNTLAPRKTPALSYCPHSADRLTRETA